MGAISRVMIANRGEIAIRIARAARGLGLGTVGVNAPADALCLHTRYVDECVELAGGDDPVAAYLDVEAIVAAAREAGCDAIHPGYGFLSENAALARACERDGITFVGPRAETLELFGDKVAARELAYSHEIPVIPGAAVRGLDEARAFAELHGYPLMVKAAAGGGGRGMRAVYELNELPEALARCASEAAAAFGSERLFVEKLIERPRHIEVQVLADKQGHVTHLYERDCSIQQRHQKVVEIAPAPQLDAALRDRILASAVRLAQEAGFRNAGTVEFLVAPSTGECYFIECNPRIQVEHTVTEAVTGVDLVEAQFRIAAGETLVELGLTEPPVVRGFAIQARVVLHGSGLIEGYREPSGAGVRVDGHGYAGYAPPPHFDPLLSKVICSGRDYTSTLARTRAALSEFYIRGVASNLSLLRGIVSHPAVIAGDARTTLLDEEGSALTGTTPEASSPVELFDAQARALLAGVPVAADAGSDNSVQVPDGDRGVECPMAGSVVEIACSVGDKVAAGDTLMVVSAMKMETVVTAPCAGTVTAIGPGEAGVQVSAGEIVVALTPSGAADSKAFERENSWQLILDEVETLKGLAEARLAKDSNDPGVVRQRSRGKLTCRERLDLLFDAGSFREVGSIAGFASYDKDGVISAFTPANHVGGWGKIEGRSAVACADDFTSRGGHSDGAIGGKSLYLDRLSMELRIPSVRLLDGSSGGGSVAAMVPEQKKEGESKAKESSGAITAGRPRVAGGGGSFLPGHLGSSPYTRQLNTVPVVNVLLGSVVGIGAAKAVLGHFAVMVKDVAQLFVAGPPVVSHAMGYDITKEDLGGWHIHCTNGSVDNLALTETEAFDMTRRFLSYLPSSVYEAPPVVACDDPPDRAEDELLTIIPRSRTSTFDVRRTIRLIADKDSFFEIGTLWGTDQVVGLIRMNGHPMGVIASDSRHENGGALTADGCDKLTRHLDLCDTFHLPLLNLIDNPGFAVGVEHEMKGAIRKGGTWMVAFAQVDIPIFTVLMRRSFGVAGNNYATPQSNPSVRVAWPAADVGGIPPEGGIEAAYKRQLAEAEDPVALRAELAARIESARGPVGPLNRFQVEEMIDPRQTRRLVCEWIGEAYRVLSHPDRLRPRDIQFRP